MKVRIKSAFSLIELLVVIGIIALLLPLYDPFWRFVDRPEGRRQILRSGVGTGGWGRCLRRRVVFRVCG